MIDRAGKAAVPAKEESTPGGNPTDHDGHTLIKLLVRGIEI